MRIVLMRGIPGSGKTTHLRRLCSENSFVCSADDHFINDEGEYLFVPQEIPIAQQRCLRKYVDWLTTLAADPHLCCDVLAVDNTNIKAIDLAPYVAIANSFGIKPEIHNIWCDAHLAHQRNSHGVPEATVFDMARRMRGDLIPPRWVRDDAIMLNHQSL